MTRDGEKHRNARIIRVGRRFEIIGLQKKRRQGLERV